MPAWKSCLILTQGWENLTSATKAKTKNTWWSTSAILSTMGTTMHLGGGFLMGACEEASSDTAAFPASPHIEVTNSTIVQSLNSVHSS